MSVPMTGWAVRETPPPRCITVTLELAHQLTAAEGALKLTCEELARLRLQLVRCLQLLRRAVTATLTII
ncbi:hypothetical protein LSTR_LSTR014981 [Laodelphax striatellus]|uniref:Uncharacterized protein n=1 Tax=Laodelphax striatellus TaxID=195883 RepID=A0A482WHB5_LAOST|nr:hypothetical protein LSTR_LSTR014981 [Laodelphax striatellus]